MSDFWLKIELSATFQASGSVTGYSITYAFWMNCSIQLSSIHSPLVASYITLTLTDSNYRVLFPIVQRRQASPFLRRRVLYPAELWRHMPQTLDFTGFLGFFPSAIYKIINSFSSCQSTDFFDLVTLERSPIWGMPRLFLRRRLLYPFN